MDLVMEIILVEVTEVSAPAYNVHTHINWSAVHSYQALVLEYIISKWVGRYMCYLDHCLPLKEVLAMYFPEGTRRRRTGTGGMVVREGTGGGVSSTMREERGS